MKYDSLLLSGGGLKCYSFLGVIHYLFDNNIIDNDFKNIKNIVTVSGGSIYIFPLLIGYSLDITIEIFKQFSINDHIDFNDISIHKLLNTYGLYEGGKLVEKFIKCLLKYKNLKEDLTLKELYELNNINYVIKTINITKEKICYLNHINHPDIPIYKVLCMSSCIPILCQPFKYKNNLYLDGGLCGHYPHDYKLKSKKKLGIRITSNDYYLNENKKNNQPDNIIDYLKIIYQLTDNQPRKKNIIDININGVGIDISKDNTEIYKYINIGYNSAKKYFENN